MPEWSTPLEVAQAALAALSAAIDADADTTFDRRLIASGPAFARDCRMVAVALDALPTNEPAGRATQPCSSVPSVSLVVSVVSDCVPTPSNGSPPVLPTADAITAHAAVHMRDVWLVARALRAWASSAGVSVGRGTAKGPGGQHAEVQWTITVELLG